MKRLWAVSDRIFDWMELFARRVRPRDVGDHRIELGRRGEREAARFLRRQGLTVVTRNFRAAGAEIDLVALDGPTLVFVEVKTRIEMGAGRPEEAVDHRKQYRLRRAAEVFAARYHAHDRNTRFDVVAICGDGSERRFEHFKDAF